MTETKFEVGEVVRTPVGLGRIAAIETRKAWKTEVIVYSVDLGGYKEKQLFTANKLRKIEVKP